MALTRAQLLSGNSSQGIVLAGQVQAVTAGTGIIISTSGVLSFDASTVTGIVKTNNSTAYNAYVWPTLPGSAGQQLTIDATGNLSWENSASTAGLGINIANNIIKTSLLAQFGPPSTGAGVGGAIDGSTYWDNTLGVSFLRYNDGTTTQWVQIV